MLLGYANCSKKERGLVLQKYGETAYNYELRMVEVKNCTKARVDTKALQAVAEFVLQKENKKHIELSVVLLKEKEIRQLNLAYRGKEYIPNVLSFEGEGDFLGEIALCPTIISKQAKEYGITNKRAMVWMLIHGVLHLLGKDHKTSAQEKRMVEKENWYLNWSADQFISSSLSGKGVN